MIADSGVPQLVADEVVVVRPSVDELLAERHGRYGIDYAERHHGASPAPRPSAVWTTSRARP